MKESVNKSIIKNFSVLIGYIKMAMSLDSYNDVYIDYKDILTTITSWSKNYIINKNFDNINSSETKRVHILLDDIRENKLFDKKMGKESFLSNEILIWYEVCIKSINDEKKRVS